MQMEESTFSVLLEPVPSKTKLNWRSYLPLYLFVMPALLLLIGYFYFPALPVIRRAFFQWDNSISGNFRSLNATFVGLDNFIFLFSDKYFWISLGNMGCFLAFQLTVPLLMPFITAEMIYHLKKDWQRQFYRTMFIIPAMVPMVVAILLWRYIYDQQGALNQALLWMHLGRLARDWLNEPAVALWAIMMIGFPFAGGNALLIFSLGLETIPREYRDSAQLDGANWLRRILRIDLPLCRPYFLILAVNTVNGIVSNFVAVLLLTQGGPLFRTLLPGYYLYEAFAEGRNGFVCATGLVLMCGALFGGLLLQKVLRKELDYHGAI